MEEKKHKAEPVELNDMERMDKELKELEIRARRAELQDLEERLAEREMKRDNKKQLAITNGQTLKQLAAGDKAAQARCNHRKGGNGAEGIVGGKGDDPQYAVLKHQFANGDIWVRCLRCGKTWKPPIEEGYPTKEEYTVAVTQYQASLEFNTRNQMSGSLQYRFSDGGVDFRKKLAQTTLR